MNRALAYSLRLCLTVSFRPELPLNTCNKSWQHKKHKIRLWAGEVIERKILTPYFLSEICMKLGLLKCY